MNNLIFLSGFLLFFATGVFAETAPKSEKSDDKIYTVQPGDILEISIWKEDTLQRDVLVRPDGGITFPLVGDLQADDKSLEQLQSEISKKLSKFISNPVVTVAARQLLGHKIYVIGKVVRPGEYIVNRYVDVMQALSMAGGMTPFSAVNDIIILRRTNNEQRSIPFRYGDLESGENLNQNIILQSGDVVIVP